VFEEDEEEEEDTLHQIKKKIKPFEITREVFLNNIFLRTSAEKNFLFF
jgi:hypothetical protein